MPEPLRCTILRSPGELESIRDAWTALWQSDPHATPFQSPEWLLPWSAQFATAGLRVVALCRGAALIGLIPSYLYQPPDGSPNKLLPLGISTSDYIDGIFAPQCCAEDVIAGLQLLLDDPGWDELSFPQLRPVSRLRSAFAQLQSPAIEEHTGQTTSRIKAAPLPSLPGKLRRNIANYRNRALREGSLELVLFNSSSWETAFSALRSLHARRWNQAGLTGVLADPRVVAWHQDAIPNMLKAGIGRLSCLCLNGDIIAVLYSLLDPPEHRERVQYCYLNGVSPDYAELSPGTLLLALTVEQAASEGIATVDLLRGDEAYKELWHAERVSTTNIICRRTSIAQRGDLTTASSQ